MKHYNVTSIILLGCFSALAGYADDWTGFRGSSGNGISEEKDLPTEWDKEKGIRWTAKLEGRGNSSPVVASGQVYVTAQRKDKSLWLHAFGETDGTLKWEHNVTSGKLPAKANYGLYRKDHDSATPTVAANSKLVCALFGTSDLICFDRDGIELWRRNLNDDYGELDINFGIGFSPRLLGDTIFLACLSKGPSYVLAIDAESGKNRWKTDRDYEAFIDGNDSYSTPAIWQKKSGETHLLVAGTDRLAAYDIRDGKEIWVTGGLKIDSKTGRIIPSPAVSDDGFVVQCSGNPQGNGRAIAFKIGDDSKGELPESDRVWTIKKRSPDRPTPLCFGGNVYIARDTSTAFCVDLQTGKQHWEQRLTGGKNYASIIGGDGKIYIHNTRGFTTVLQAGNEFQKISVNQLPGSPTFNATPAIANGALFFRNYETLIAVDGKN